MKKNTLMLWGLCFCFVFSVFPGKSAAFYVDDEKTCDISGKVQARAAWRTEDTDYFTSPAVDSGDLVQQRNLLYVEVNHDLRNISWPGDLNVKYHLRGRLMYDGVYDYGPKMFSEAENENFVKNLDQFKTQVDLWEAYADFSRGPLFFRIGRQNLSWGETDVFRLLDNINPLDNTFGGIFEDLDDRRIPLWMLRSSYNIGKVGPINSFMVEGFWVPGVIDNTVSPISPPGTAYAVPNPPVSANSVAGVVYFYDRKNEPEDDLSSSRWGARLMGVLGDNLTFSLAYYKSYLDSPVVSFVVDRQFNPLLGIPAGVALEYSFEEVRISGGSLNYYEENIDAVIRSEVAWLQDVPVFIEGRNIPDPNMLGGILPQFVNGEIPKKDQLRFALAMDKDVWMRALNRTSQFNCTFQYTLQYTDAYDDMMRTQVLSPYTQGFTIRDKEYEQSLTLILMNNGGWMNGNLKPQFTSAYDPRGAWLFMPQVEYLFDPFRIKLNYSAITGNFVGFGFYRDRDQVSVDLTLLF